MKLSESFYLISNLSRRIKAIQGSQGGGKTYAILQRWILLAQKSKNKQLCSIVTDTMPNLKKGAIKDFKEICKDADIDFTELKNPYQFGVNGWTFEFFSVDKESKGLGGRRDRLFINEANRLPWKTARQLIGRTHKEVLFDFNPVERFWVHEFFVEVDKCDFVKLTYKNNEHLPSSEVEMIEQFSPWGATPDANYWRVYGCGEIGFVEGTIYSNYETYKTLPGGKLIKAYGSDFGWEDPMTLVEVNYDKRNNALYWKLLFYASHAKYEDYNAALRSKSEYNNEPVISDTQPREIMALRKYNISAMAVNKKSGISADIRAVKQCKLYLHEDSEQMIKETRKYKWQEKNGSFIDYPIDAHNHALDAARYSSVFLINNY